LAVVAQAHMQMARACLVGLAVVVAQLRYQPE